MNPIQVVNFKNGAETPHEIVILKCQLENGAKLIQVQQGQKVEEFPVNRRGRCKILLKLEPNVKTDLELRAGEEVKSFCLEYRPKLREKSIQVVQLRCKDQEVGTDFEKNSQKLLLGLKLVQCIFGEKIFEATGERKCFNLEPKVEVFTLNLSLEEAYRLSDFEL